MWAYYIGLKFLQRKKLAAAVFKYLGLAVLLHGIYDFMVIALPLSALPLSALLILAIWLWRMHLVRDLQRKSGKSGETGD
jgi:RsiW-degrading membrane proteinase PrsW (M82 family)